MKNYKKRFLAGFALIILASVVLVTLIDLPQLLEKNTSGSLRTFVLRTAGIAIPLKDRILGRTSADNMIRLQSTGTCQFCDLTSTESKEMDLSGVDLRRANLTAANLTGANLWTTTLTGANLTRTNLMGAILIDTNLTQAILTDAYLYDANMVNADLSKSNLVGARLSGTNLAGANFRKANLGGIDFEQTHENLGKNVIEIKEGGNFSRVTSFDFKGDEHYLTTQSGILYEFKNGESTVVLDLNNDPKFPGKGPETGLLSVVSNNNFVYISYTIEGDDRQKIYLVVDEYSKTFNKNRTIIQIGIPEGIHNAGTLVFDNFGKMYLSVGDGGPQGDPENHAQDLNSLRCKILRLDVSKKTLSRKSWHTASGILGRSV